MQPYGNRNRKIEGLALDLDGTLLRSEHVHCISRQKVFARYGVTLTDEDYKQHWIRTSGGIGYVASLHSLDPVKVRADVRAETLKSLHLMIR